MQNVSPPPCICVIQRPLRVKCRTMWQNVKSLIDKMLQNIQIRTDNYWLKPMENVVLLATKAYKNMKEY